MTRHFRVGNVPIGESARTFIVAELSANHGGSLDIALKTVDAAAKAGADAIKVQTYTPDTLTLNSSAPPFIVRTKNEWAGRTLYDLYKEAMTPWEWHAPLQSAARNAGLVFFSTPFDATATEFLSSLDVPAYKIASFEIVDLALVDHVARRGKPMIISTGMASLGEIEAAVRVCRRVGNDEIALLRCVSAYPAQPNAMNLRSLATLNSFGVVIGLSDHTRDSTVATAAVTLGAKLVEKHFILDRSAGGPDAFFSLEPEEFRAMVDAIRNTEAALGPARFGPSQDEVASTAFRRSLFVARNVAANSTITIDDVRSVRPANGIAARHLPEVLGTTAVRDLVGGEPMRWEYIQGPLTPTVTLRPASADDAPLLLALRNDPKVIEASVTNEAVAAASHAQWLSETMASDSRSLFVALRDDAPIGQARIDRVSAEIWEVSMSLMPKARSKGLASQTLRSLERVARGRGIEMLVARIRHSNERSIKAFKSAGYYAFVTRTTPEGEFVLCERRIACDY